MELDAYLKQLKQMGLDDATIEIYKQQFFQSMQLMGNSGMEQIIKSGVQQQLNQFWGDDEVDSAGEHVFDMDAYTNLSLAQQWAMACGANLSFANRQKLNTLETGMDEDTAASQLSEWWGVDSGSDLMEALEFLRDGGHRKRFELIAEIYNNRGDNTKKDYYASKISELMEEEDAEKYMNNFIGALELFGNDKLLPEDGKAPNMLAWDLVRLINLCRSGYDAGYISKKEALEIALDCARLLQQNYKSWKELSVAYLFARCVWGGCESYSDWKNGMDTLLSGNSSPWVKFKWDTKLD